MKSTTKLKPFYIYAPIQRLDEEERIAEGYCYINARVKSDNCNLKRKAMEAATADYMEWANVREMHQPIAAGNALSVTWDENGAWIRVRVVDDAAWAKVKEGVYKGFSVGFRALEGTTSPNGVIDVETCEWYETSLVDRPADPDAKVYTWRSNGVDPSAEYEVEIIGETLAEETAHRVLDAEQGASTRMENETVEIAVVTDNSGETTVVDVSVAVPESEATVADFTAAVADYEETTEANKVMATAYDAIYTLFNVLDNIYYSDVPDKAAAMRTSIRQFSDYLATSLGDAVVAEVAATEDGAEAERSIDFKSLLTRLNAGATPTPITGAAGQPTQVQRALETAKAETTRLSADLATANGTVSRLNAEVARLNNTSKTKPPVRYPEAAERTFAANTANGEGSKAAETLRAEIATLESTLRVEPDQKKRQDGVANLQRLKMQLHEVG